MKNKLFKWHLHMSMFPLRQKGQSRVNLLVSSLHTLQVRNFMLHDFRTVILLHAYCDWEISIPWVLHNHSSVKCGSLWGQEAAKKKKKGQTYTIWEKQTNPHFAHVQQWGYIWTITENVEQKTIKYSVEAVKHCYWTLAKKRKSENNLKRHQLKMHTFLRTHKYVIYCISNICNCEKLKLDASAESTWMTLIIRLHQLTGSWNFL